MATTPQPAQPGGPYPENFRDVHDEMIAIDAAGPLLDFPPYGELLADPWDLYKQGGADIVSTKEDIAKIWGGNWLRIMGQIWG